MVLAFWPARPERGRAAGATLAALLLLPEAAHAHSALPGIEGFYRGLLHPLATPSTLVALLALGVLLGRGWPRAFVLGWPVFAAGLAAGLGLAAARGVPEFFDPALFALAAAAGAVAALFAAGPLALVLPLTAAIGVGQGIAAWPEPGPARDVAFTVSGSVLGANLALLYLAAGVDWVSGKLDAPWIGIAFRVLAAWIAALAMLMAALAFAPPVS